MEVLDCNGLVIKVGDIVYINGNPSEQYEIISINNKNNIVIKNRINKWKWKYFETRRS